MEVVEVGFYDYEDTFFTNWYHLTGYQGNFDLARGNQVTVARCHVDGYEYPFEYVVAPSSQHAH